MSGGRVEAIASRRAILVVLDGYDAAIGERFAAEGHMPALRQLIGRSARFDLEHGDARWTGLAGEHVSTGLAPLAAARFSAVTFDPARYTVRQHGTALTPFTASLPLPCVVFNPTYFDLARAPGTRGLVGWGGVHDPGAAACARPESLAAEVTERFGTDPGLAWTYSVVWLSPDRTRQMAAALSDAVGLKTRIAAWLLSERIPDWRLAIVGIGEVHSALEAMWHGIDPAHPLHDAPSAAHAASGVRSVYGAVDRLFSMLSDAFPDATLIVASLHGMGPNASDVAGIALLPELLYRHATGSQLLRTSGAGADARSLSDDGDWSGALQRRFEQGHAANGAKLPRWRGIFSPRRQVRDGAASDLVSGDPAMDWMPATWFRRHWPQMPAFALPAYYDGRIRINLAGREREGKVQSSAYTAVCRRIEALIRECRDIDTGAPVVAALETRSAEAASTIGPTEADMVVRWHGAPAGFAHPRLGRIGPFPYKRTGGHTGGHGVAYFAGPGIPPGRNGIRIAFDVIPTVLDLLGVDKPPHLSGERLFTLGRTG